MDIALSKNNIPIRLTSERWLHITMGHPEIADHYHEILETIENPEIVFEGNNDAKIAVRAFRESLTNFMQVVYKETSETDGFVITAHLSNKKEAFQKKKIVWKHQQ
jgi:hypothetical protein